MTKNMFSLYWKTNPKWWTVNSKGEYELTSEATEEARRSFEEWSKG